VEVDGPVDAGVTIDIGEAAAISFTLDEPVTDFAVSAELTCIGCSGGMWLHKNSLGAEASFADTIAGDFCDGTTPMPLFSALELDTGSYFLIINIDDGFTIWSGTTVPTLTEHPSANREIDFFATETEAYTPFSDFDVIFGSNLQFTATGIVVPEPAAALLFGVGLAGISAARRLRV